MKKINIIDLDKTLISFDSFRYLIIQCIKNMRINIILYTMLRFMRVISSEQLKLKVISEISLPDKAFIVNETVQKILKSFNQDVINLVNNNTDVDTINILCSASPDIYVKIVSEHLNWIGIGSFIQNSQLTHMYGKNKVSYILSRYPSNKYYYNFAISDSMSDFALLKKFDNYILYK